MTESTPTADTKVRKFPCEGCGADIRWDPGASALKCPFCGFVKKIAVEGPAIEEKPIDAAPRAPRELGWGTAKKTIRCTRCGAVSAIDANLTATACAFCGTAAVVETPANAEMIRPEGLLPFRIARTQAVNDFHSWISGLWFRPSDLASTSTVTAIQGVYIPFWTFDAATHSWWTAEAGYFYYVEVSDRDSQGNTVMRQEQRVRWEPASGQLEKFFDDVPVPASKGIEPGLCRSIEPFPTHELVPYDSGYLSGFLAEEYAVGLDDALESAKERMRNEARDACAREVPGDTQRNLNVDTTFSGLAYKNALLPIWIAAYLYHGESYRFLVNGVTGQVAGKAPYSWVKIFFAVAAVIALLIVIAVIKGHAR